MASLLSAVLSIVFNNSFGHSSKVINMNIICTDGTVINPYCYCLLLHIVNTNLSFLSIFISLLMLARVKTEGDTSHIFMIIFQPRTVNWWEKTLITLLSSLCYQFLILLPSSNRKGWAVNYKKTLHILLLADDHILFFILLSACGWKEVK